MEIRKDSVAKLLEIGDDGNPSIPYVHILPKIVATAFGRCPAAAFSMTESALELAVKPNYLDIQIKKRLWEEFIEMDKTGCNMKVSRMIHGVCNTKTFYSRMQTNPMFVAWLMIPISTYATVIEGFMHDAKKRYADLINMSINKYKDGEPTNEVDPKKASVLLAVIKNLEDRSMGSALQRQISVSTKEPSGKEDKAALDMTAVNKRLKELELQLGESMPATNEEYIEAEVMESVEPQIQCIDRAIERIETENDGLSD